MRSALLLCVALGAAVAAAAPVPPGDPRDVPKLIETLGSEDFTEREAATKRLDELGLLALQKLRAATRSENPEIADRAKDLVKRIERRAANERILAPTIVDLDLADTPLDEVLAALSKQAGFEVVVGGLNANDLAGKKITVSTGKVPFWVAVQKVCAGGGLQVASAGGFVAPGAMPFNVRPGRTPAGAPVRTARNHNTAVVLEAREGDPRPASVHGAVMVEAFALPKGTESRTVAATVLQVWPEPKLAWQANADAKVTHAVDPKKQKLIPDFTPVAALPQVQRVRGNNVVVVRNPDGSLTMVNPNAKNPLEIGPNFTPNARQSLIKLKTASGTAAELNGSVYGMTRSGVEALAAVALAGDKPVTARGAANTVLTALLRTDAKGKRLVEVQVYYEPNRVQPARQNEELPGSKLTAGGNSTILGVRVTDADGTPFDLALPNQSSNFDPSGRQIVARLTLQLLDGKDPPRAPATVTAWGTYTRSVEVPFALKDVPLTGGPK